MARISTMIQRSLKKDSKEITVAYRGEDENNGLPCSACKWEGDFEALSEEVYDYHMAFSCPSCGMVLATVSYNHLHANDCLQ